MQLHFEGPLPKQQANVTTTTGWYKPQCPSLLGIKGSALCSVFCEQYCIVGVCFSDSSAVRASYYPAQIVLKVLPADAASEQASHAVPFHCHSEQCYTSLNACIVTPVLGDGQQLGWSRTLHLLLALGKRGAVGNIFLFRKLWDEEWIVSWAPVSGMQLGLQQKHS